MLMEKCKFCGSLDDPNEYVESSIKKLMLREECCFRCAFWIYQGTKMNSIASDMIHLVVNGNKYSFPKDEPIYGVQINGWSWRPIPVMHYILFENGEVYRTNQLWHQGEIPIHFRDKLPNDAVFIDKSEYQQIHNMEINEDSGYPERCPQPFRKNLLDKYNFSK